MRRTLLFCIVMLLACSSAGCADIALRSSQEAEGVQPTMQESTASQPTASENAPSQTASAESRPLQGDVYNKDGSMRLDVFVNDALMDVKVYDDEITGVLGTYHFGEYAQADPIMDFLGITYDADEATETLVMTSEKYGDIGFWYGWAVRMIDDVMYVSLDVFRAFTDGSLLQYDCVTMHLYTGDYERPDLPVTLEECYAALDGTLRPEEIQFIKNATQEDLEAEYALGLGLWIRNNWLYSTHSRLHQLFFENGENDFIRMSALILEGYVRYLNGEPCTLEDMLGQ